MDNEEIYRKAKKKVKAKKGFFYHFIAYACVLGMLYAIMHFENKGEILPVIIVGLSWGIGLGAHYFKTFGTEHLDFLGFSPDWEEEELEKEIQRLERKQKLKKLMEADKEDFMFNDEESLELKEMEKRRLDENYR